jgi:ribonuclease P protein subunit POP4
MSRLGTPASASGAATPASGAATPVTTDLYRPLAAQIQRTVAPLAGPSSTPSLASLLGLDTSTYSSRLSGKNLLLTDLPSAGSELVRGRKKNRGDPKALAETKAAQAAVVAERRKKGLGSVRKARAVTGSATRIE